MFGKFKGAQQSTSESRELVVKLDNGLCFDDFGRAVTSLLEDLLYRTSHIEQPVKRLDILREKLTPRNKVHFERLEKTLESVERLASSGSLAEVVLLQGSTVSLAQYVTHIRLETMPWNDNTSRHRDALKLSKLNLFRAVASVDDILAPPTHGARSAKCFLFIRVNPRHPDETSIDGFEIRPTLPNSRAKCRTIFKLCQTNDDKRHDDDDDDDNNNRNRNNNSSSSSSSSSSSRKSENSPSGVWLQLTQHLPSVSISS